MVEWLVFVVVEKLFVEKIWKIKKVRKRKK